MHARKVAWMDGKADNVMVSGDALSYRPEDLVCDFDSSLLFPHGTHKAAVSEESSFALSGTSILLAPSCQSIPGTAPLSPSLLANFDYKCTARGCSQSG